MTAELITQAEYARRRGVSEAAVSKAVKAGRITLINGRIDPVIADLQWETNTRKAIGRGGAATTSAPVRLRAHPESPPADVQANDEATGEDPPAAGGHYDYERSRARREHYEAQLAEARALERLGQLVQTSDVKRAVTDIVRIMVDALERLPDRVTGRIHAQMKQSDIYNLIERETVEMREDLARAFEDLPRKLGPQEGR